MLRQWHHAASAIAVAHLGCSEDIGLGPESYSPPALAGETGEDYIIYGKKK